MPLSPCLCVIFDPHLQRNKRTRKKILRHTANSMTIYLMIDKSPSSRFPQTWKIWKTGKSQGKPLAERSDVRKLWWKKSMFSAASDYEQSKSGKFKTKFFFMLSFCWSVNEFAVELMMMPLFAEASMRRGCVVRPLHEDFRRGAGDWMRRRKKRNQKYFKSSEVNKTSTLVQNFQGKKEARRTKFEI